MPLIGAFRKHRQVDLCEFETSLGLHSMLQASHGDTVRTYLRAKQRKNLKDEKQN